MTKRKTSRIEARMIGFSTLEGSTRCESEGGVNIKVRTAVSAVVMGARSC